MSSNKKDPEINVIKRYIIFNENWNKIKEGLRISITSKMYFISLPLKDLLKLPKHYIAIILSLNEG